MLLTGKTVVVTGGGRGIGQAMVRGLAAQGANIAIADIGAADESVEIARALGADAAAFATDATDAASFKATIDATVERWGSVDVLVNNLGIYNPIQSIEEQTVECWDKMFDTNVKSILFGVQAVLPAMKKQGGGKIINVGSGVFFLGNSRSSAYTASKGAVVGLTRNLARQLGPQNIFVNVVSPGLVPSTPGMSETNLSDELLASIVATQCIRRPSVPDDLAGPVVFLASDLSNFITGQIINVDGGAMMVG